MPDQRIDPAAFKIGTARARYERVGGRCIEIVEFVVTPADGGDPVVAHRQAKEVDPQVSAATLIGRIRAAEEDVAVLKDQLQRLRETFGMPA